jgi:non-ribosomal peptide synthetase component F
MLRNSSGRMARERATVTVEACEADGKLVDGIGETPVSEDPEIVVATTTWRQSEAQNSVQLGTGRQARDPQPSRRPPVQTTFPRLMLEHAKTRPDAPALREKEYGIWQTLTWSALAALVRAIACGMAANGVKRDDHLVVIGENRPRLYASMLAAQALGAVPVPLYQDAVAPEYAFPINNAEVRFAVVEDQEQVDKMLDLREQCPQLQHIWFDDPRGLRKYDEPGCCRWTR